MAEVSLKLSKTFALQVAVWTKQNSRKENSLNIGCGFIGEKFVNGLKGTVLTPDSLCTGKIGSFGKRNADFYDD